MKYIKKIIGYLMLTSGMLLGGLALSVDDFTVEPLMFLIIWFTSIVIAYLLIKYGYKLSDMEHYFKNIKEN